MRETEIEFGSLLAYSPHRVTSGARHSVEIMADHFNSLEVQGVLEPPPEILLIDDVITYGSTVFGAANRLPEVFPGSRIRAFAAIRTVSASKFEQSFRR